MAKHEPATQAPLKQKARGHAKKANKPAKMGFGEPAPMKFSPQKKPVETNKTTTAMAR
jgi:hypothetical protein